MSALSERSRIIVLSPHLDDAVLSLGATIAASVRAGADVSILTVFAGDPASSEPAGAWDRRVGFRDAGEAIRVRRDEDRVACTLLGVRPIWLPFPDEQYRAGDWEEPVMTAIADAVVGADALLVPGFPLLNDDHRWLSHLVASASPVEQLGLYVEQPYAAWYWTFPEPSTPRALGLSAPVAWKPVHSGRRDRRRKRAATRAYASQVRRLGRWPLLRIALWEAAWGGEPIAWLPRRPAQRR